MDQLDGYTVPTVRPYHAANLGLRDSLERRMRVDQLWACGPSRRTDGPGSTGKNRPECLSWSLRAIQETAGWTTMSILRRRYVSACRHRRKVTKATAGWKHHHRRHQTQRGEQDAILSLMKLDYFVHVSEIDAHTSMGC